MEQTVLRIEQPRDATLAGERAGEVFAAGGLVVFPTETVYGIGASVANDAGYAALRRVKEREDGQPFTLHVPEADAVGRYVDMGNPLIARLVGKMLPGPVTLIVDVPEDVIEQKLRVLGLSSEHRARLYHGNTIGIRCPDDDVARLVLGSTDEPIAASSANRRNHAPPRDGREAIAAIGDAADLMIDAGQTRYAKPSTIVRVSLRDGGYDYTIQREGVYDQRFLQKLMRWTLLFVCTGNTCRSPMAEAMARRMLAERRGVDPAQLGEAGSRVVSAGVAGAVGAPASEQAVEAMRLIGLDLSDHRSRALTPELAREADVIYCMSESHRMAVLAMAPDVAGKVYLLDETADIDDPFGADLSAYQQTADIIRAQLERRLKEQQL